jgi:sugar phosphate isomerase/epimerase
MDHFDKTRIGCSTITFRNCPLPEALDRIKRRGMVRVDIGVVPGFCPHFDPWSEGPDERKRVLIAVRSRALRVSTLNTAPGSFNDPHADHDAIRRACRASFALAHELGCYAVTVNSGLEAPDGEWHAQAVVIADHMRELGLMAHDHGVELSIEAPHVGAFVHTNQQAVDLLDMIGLEHVTVTFDTSHVHLGGGTILEAFAAVKGRIGHVHLRDAAGEDFLVTPGEGEVDFRGFIRELVASRYRRDLNLELEYHGATPDETEAELVKAYDHIMGLAISTPTP